MKKFNPNKNIIITLVIVIIVVTVLSVTAAQRANEGKPNFFQSIVNDSVSFVDRTISAPVKWVQNGVDSVHHLFTTYSENERLKEKIDSYDEIAQKNKNMQKEIDALKSELDLSQTLTSYERVTANVITRSPDSWQDLLVVDKGSNDGIEVNMAVMAQKGLVGRVIEVNATSSKVELLTSSNVSSNHFPVRVSSGNGESFGLLKNYDEKLQALVVTQLTGDSEIKEGDVVQTSGLGGNSPADLQIGTVIKTKPDSYGLDREVYVKPYADMYDLPVVTIIKRLVEE
ncbi:MULTISPECIES: rod shape-determining protein MreC [Enterococcus]|uniref:Cell shape-determining protein MreC n=1 Tax=Enterococcus mundtii TaxID=53346 RepID=A0A1A6G8G0_ENTMU|nr:MULTISPECIES: rod shape-determining protein MreC [Enterococcus]MBE6171709.1 rod shape-determining protein MreC [Enterococcus faecium]MBO0461937.1 rod shape-determining protein MreC [Enterococcus sp. DIV1298c]GEN17896.1 cell shape-determining protein MreC [Ligilactobacillus acidipiscis]AUB53852.1 rod shape-determining protein MreC [Enterococcus mundtii]AZP93822.1 rod shape-determining protein MreC [Enterococcus mundtii]